MKLANITLAPTIRKYNKENLVHDVITGLIIMAVSIPISMGYAQIAGLPAVYGLYGSVFPILLFALFSTSPQFVFGVDAAPAALVGSALLGMNIEGGSKEALAVVPVLTFFVAVWLFAFYLMHAGKLVNYISEPVMGGFITGICTTIILMQVPKLMGGSAGTGEFLELAEHIIKAVRQINMPSLVLGSVSLVILLVAKKLVPKFPMAVVLMVLGAVLTNILPMTAWGIKTLDAVETGLPKWNIPDFTVVPIREVITISLSVAVVIMAETLLAENNFAQKNRYRINDNQEILAFAVGNMAAAFTGCSNQWFCFKNCDGGTIPGKNAGDEYCCRFVYVDFAALRNWIYRVSSDSGAYSHRDFSTARCDRISSCDEAVESQPDRIFYFCRCICRSTFSWDDQWCIDWNYFIIFRNDNPII